MIKANELQIGDWVQNPLGYKAQVLDIRYIKDVGDGYGGGYLIHIGERNWEGVQWLEEKDIEPIPLTSEILEKNGWVKFQTYYRRHYIDGSQYLEWYPHEGRLQRLYIHKNNSREVVFTVNGLSYVHQLQHALKLCGIDKEITL